MVKAATRESHTHTYGSDKPDRGATGPAMLARPKQFMDCVGTDRLMDNHPLDFYTSIDALTERQRDAGWRLAGLYRMGFPQAVLSARIGERGRELPSDNDEEEKCEARRQFRELTDRMPVLPGRMIARIVRAEYPDTSMGVTALKDGLDIVADRMNLPKKNSY